jgi:N-ethylmaleimide reductase
VSHRSLQPNGEAPVAPSAIQATSSRSVIHGADGGLDRAPCDMPRALETGEIPGIVADYVAAARRARRAGFDFVEIHSANGYLLNQFLASQTNQRTDAYGGSIENRIRIVLEVVDAVAAEIGAERVGVRLSPHGVMNDMICPETEATTLALMRALDARKIAFVHIAEPDWAGGAPLTDSFRQQLRDAFSGVLVFCGGYTAERAETLIARGIADAVAFGRPYIANPDLVERFRRGAPLNTPNADTFYGGGEAGYTDYPTLSAA